MCAAKTRVTEMIDGQWGIFRGSVTGPDRCLSTLDTLHTCASILTSMKNDVAQCLEQAPFRAFRSSFFLLKVPTSTFTFKNLCKTPRFLRVKALVGAL